MAPTSHLQPRSIAGVVEQGQHVASFLVALRPAEFCRTVPGTTHRVRDVAAELVISQNQLLAALDRPTAERPQPLASHVESLRFSRAHLKELADELAEHESGPALADQFQQQLHEISHRLEAGDLPEIVAVSTPLRLADLVRLVAVELVLHSDDLTRAVPGHRPVQLHRGVAADAVRVLAETMRARYPGREIEIRVPPFVAIQCGTGSGPRHTRGTPPNVVECEPISFVRLCRGRQPFSAAARQGHLQASGIRADISDWLPLY